MSRILAFGEIMMRLQTPGFERFSQNKSFDLCFGGAEANVAVCLAQFGEDVTFFTKLPTNDFGEACVSTLKKYDVNVKHILRGGERIGIYFCEKGVSQRPSKVVYDRKNSAINDIKIEEINFEDLFSGVKWFHFSGITAALSSNVLNILESLIIYAKSINITVSCDLNYRKNLWSIDQARKTMTRLVLLSDVLISNEEECKNVFNIEDSNSDIDRGVIDVSGYKKMAESISEKFPNLNAVAFTLRESVSASINRFSGLLYTKKESVFSKRYEVNVVDRIGTGDSFTAGLIYSLLNKKNLQYAVEFAVASACLKHTIEGDFNEITTIEVENLIESGGNGRVQR